MNTRLKLYLIRNLRNSEPGFALPLAIMIGLILVGGGMMMISLSQGDQIKALTQKARSDGLVGTEAGLARAQEYLNTIRVMAKYHSHLNTDSSCVPSPDKRDDTCTPCTSEKPGDQCWKTATIPSSGEAPRNALEKELKALNASAACTSGSDPKIISNTLGTMQSILSTTSVAEDGNNKLFLYYTIEDYVYRKVEDRSTIGLTQQIGTGILTLTGRSRKSAMSNSADAPTDNGASENRLVVSMPVLSSLPVSFTRTTVPALWIQSGAIDESDGSQFQGDVVMSDPNALNNAPDQIVARAKLECDLDKKLPQPKPAVNPVYQARFFPADENENNKPALAFPSLPVPSFNFLKDLGRILDNPNEYKQENPETYKEYQQYQNQVNLELKESTTFPRNGDKTTTRNINGRSVDFYEYEIKSIELDANETIKIDSSAGARVIFFVRGEIKLDKTSKIEHTCKDVNGNTMSDCNPGNFQIFARNSVDPKLSDPSICLPIGDSETLVAFIFAPDYKLGINGKGQVNGAMWGKTWGQINDCKGNNSNVAIVQSAEWTNLIVSKPEPLEELPQIGRILAWCEESIESTIKESQCVPKIIRAIGESSSSSESPSPSPTTSGSPVL